jgi:Trypsin-co-occurring domain 1
LKGNAMTDLKDRTLMIYVADSVRIATATAPKDEAALHARQPTIGEVIGKVTSVPVETVQGQWNETLDTLMNMSGEIAARAESWKIDEIEVGLTLSAKGELLFIAEAGAEASIKVTLKPKTQSVQSSE